MTRPIPTIPSGLDTPVTLINAFTVDMAKEERFLARWRDNARVLATAPGFIGARMMRAVSDKAELTFINVAEWESGVALDEAHRNPEWIAAARRFLDDPEFADAKVRPMQYQAVITVKPGDTLR
ncbi:antibiotic biosynthesis monooxygenase family protein [Pseudonocardia sp. CA-107938]|uniref:antibiotic biosynthesis monooxygenase family protein n=1 Tax=Pseudonocardia sp. CA-107938 TaxID=3240021 RepID=UPI003D936118